MLKKDLSPTNLILNSMSCGFFPLKTGAAHKPTRINKKPTLLIWPACQCANGNTKPLYAGSVLSSCLACLARTLRSFELSDSLLFRASCGLFAFSAVAASHDSSPLGSGVGGPFSYSLCFPKIKLRVVQFRGFSKMTSSSLQAQAPRVILSAFSPSHCIEKTKRKPVCQVCQLRAS